jgi:hypothetical protein
MSYRFHMVVGSVDVLNEFMRNNLEGVSISHEGAKPGLPPTMAYDSAEEILQIIVNFSRDLNINLLAAWIALSIQNQAGGKKTTIEGHQIPKDQAELAALIVELIKKQEQKKHPKKTGR